MLTGKHDREPENTNARWLMSSGLKVLVNFQKSGSDKAKVKKSKICCSISMFMNVTIHGTHGLSQGFSTNSTLARFGEWPFETGEWLNFSKVQKKYVIL